MISADDRARIAAAIKTAEQKTAGEIVCVLMRASSAYSYAPVLWAAFVALASPWAMLALTSWSVSRILGAQILVFVAVYALLYFTPLRMALVPAAIKRTRAHRAAMEQFFARGVTQTQGRMAVLIFVSLAEHYVHVIADDGVARLAPPETWTQAVDDLTTNLRQRRIADGFVAAVERCGDVLARCAPPDGKAHVLADRIYVL